jgi:sec-independent protein translocase protein TatA
MPNLGPWELGIILVVVVLIFGAGKLSEVGGAVGKSIKEFRKASSEDDGKGKDDEAKAVEEDARVKEAEARAREAEARAREAEARAKEAAETRPTEPAKQPDRKEEKIA